MAGEAASFSIDWPALVPDGYVMPVDEGPNLALGAPAVCNTRNAGDGPVHLINDGVIPSSKWCGLSERGYAVLDLGKNMDISRWVVYHANCPGAGEGVAMNTVDFNLEYAPDDGLPLLTGDNKESKDRVAAMDFKVADSVVNNKLDITDRNLAEPITARYLQLYVSRSDNSPWSAIRIYEFELYENPAIDNTPSPNEKNVVIHNNAGANDTVVIDNVPMPYATGAYPGGSVAADTGVVRLFSDLTSQEPIATVKAEQPENTYKMRAMGKAAFEGLELNPEGGRLYFDVLKDLGAGATNSRRSSVAYGPEAGETAKLADSVTILPGTAGKQVYQTYATVKATGLEEGASLWIYADEAADLDLGRSLPAKNGEALVNFIPLQAEGGNLYYEVHLDGKTTSARTAVPYGAVADMTADLSGLAELVEKCDLLQQSDCTSATWDAFAQQRAAAQAVLNAGSATVAEAENARAALAEAYANLRFVDHAYAQRLSELCDELEEKYPAENYQPASYKLFAETLAEARAAVAAGDSDRWEMEQLILRLVKSTRSITATLTGISISPAEVSMHPGDTQEFKILTEGDAGADASVTWQVLGAHSGNTVMFDNILTVGHDEVAGEFTVKAISHADPNLTATATVTVLSDEGGTPEPGLSGNMAKNAAIVAYDGPEYGTGSIGHATGPEKMFDGVKATDAYGWWGLSRPTANVVFDLGRSCSVESFILYNIGSAPGRETNENTVDYEFYTLNTEKLSVEDFLAADQAARNAYMTDAQYWNEAVTVTNNTENIAKHVVDLQDVQIIKFHVARANRMPADFQAVQITELEVMGAASSVTPPVDEVQITVDTDAVTVVNTPGMKNQFTATVTGSDNVEVLWSVSGNTSEDTRVNNGLLFLGRGEEAEQLIITAAAAADPSKTATITVTLVPETFEITVSPLIENGVVTVSAETAAAGETVTVTVEPAKGYRLVEGSLKANAAVIEGGSFVMPAEAVVITAEFEADQTDLLAAAQAAKEAAEAAKTAAEEAQQKAEAAAAAAEAAEGSAAADKTAAEAARVKAEAAQAAAEAAKSAAAAAQTAAEEAKTAAEASQAEAALSASQAAADAKAAAEQAVTAAEEARKAASAQAAAQEAQASAEAAQKVAEQAARDAKAAQEAADEASASAASDKAAAEKAQQEAEKARQAAADAQAAAENAKAAAENAKAEAENANEAAAKSASEAAKSAEAAAESFRQITEMKKEMAQYLEDAQKAKEEAEAAQKAAEAAELACSKYEALFALSCYVDADDYRATERELLEATIDAGVKSIGAAASVEEVRAALKEAQTAIDAIPTAEEQKLPFTDVKEGDWYEDAVRYVYRNEIFNGVTETEFAPRATMTRAQMVTALFRLAGEPEVENNAHPFKDVRSGAYYEKAVIWGYQTGIVSGTTDTAFAPDEPVTRGQAAVLLYRLSGDEKVEEDHLEAFADAKDVPAYAAEALNWAVANEILNGAREGEDLFLAAANHIKRAEAAAIIMRIAAEA